MGLLSRWKRKQKSKRGITLNDVKASCKSVLPEQLTPHSIRMAISKTRKRKEAQIKGVDEMVPRVERLIRNKGERISVEAISSEGLGHAAHIVLKERGGHEVLARTDAKYETAEQAVAVAQAAVDNVRGIDKADEADDETKVIEEGE